MNFKTIGSITDVTAACVGQKPCRLAVIMIKPASIDMRIVLIILLTTLVATCGQKGPLRLPEPEAKLVEIPDRKV